MFNLTRSQARQRAQTVSVSHIDVTVDLTRAGDLDETHYPVTSVFTMTLNRPSTFVDVVGTVDEVLVDDAPHAFHHDGSRLDLDDLPISRPITLTVRAHCSFSRTGEGLHRYLDPEDHRIYLYTQFEPTDARRAWPCMDQPDIKPPWTFHVLAPKEWTVTSNGIDTPTDAGTFIRHDFSTTPPLSSYITAVVAGQWAVVDGGTWEGGAGDGTHVAIPLRLMCRAALAPFMDDDDILTVTRQGLNFYHQHYGVTFPWGSYDQVFVPEYNLGAMENPGCVTFNEHLLSRDTPTFAQRQHRANTILHEMCHMWFGDLVTPAWWDDLWLKESFADHQGTNTAAHATAYTGEWTSFAIGRKAWAYEQDQYPTTHPIAADIPDVEAAKNNFDGITYAKGAAVLRQLFAALGEDAFFAGARLYFTRHANGATKLTDLLEALEETSGQDLTEWSRLWLETSGPSRLSIDVQFDHSGRLSRFDLVQDRLVRPHTLEVSTWAIDEGALRRTHTYSLHTEAARIRITDDTLSRGECDLIVLNDHDLTYAICRFDAHSADTALAYIGTCPDPLTRAVVWANLWNMVRDGLMRADRYVRAVLTQALTEDHDAVVDRLLSSVQYAIAHYCPRSQRAALHEQVVATALDILSHTTTVDPQRLWLGALLSSAPWCPLSPAATSTITAVAGRHSIHGLEIGPELAWRARRALAARGDVDRARLDQWLDNERTGETTIFHARAVAALPTATIREQSWKRVLTGDISNEETSAILFGLAESTWEGDELDREFFAHLADFWATHSIGMGIRFVRAGAPHHVDCDDPDAVATLVNEYEQWLEGNTDAPAALRRLVIENFDDVQRAQRVQELWEETL